MAEPRVDYVDFPRMQPDEVADTIAHKYFPIFKEGWDKKWMHIYRTPIDFDVESLVALCCKLNPLMFFAYDGQGEISGYYMGVPFRPIPYKDRVVLQTESWYARDTETMERLFMVLSDALPFTGATEVWCPYVNEGECMRIGSLLGEYVSVQTVGIFRR